MRNRERERDNERQVNRRRTREESSPLRERRVASEDAESSKGGLLKNIYQGGAMDLTFFVAVIALVSVGLVMLFTASYANALYLSGDSFKYIKQQGVFAVVGIIAMLLISRVNVDFLKKCSVLIYGVAIVFLILALVMSGRGFRRWLYLGPIGFQPSEIAKFALILCLAHFTSKYSNNMNTIPITVTAFLIAVPVCALTVLEPHLSATVIMVLITVIMIIVAGGKLSLIAGGGIAVGLLGLAFVTFTNKMAYASQRLQYWFHPEKDIAGKGWQTIQALYALGSGGLLGQGFGKSNQKYLYMPEPQNDFIFAIIGEELGFIGAILIIALFAYFIYRGFVIALRARDKFSTMLALGITLHIGMQCAFNLLVVTNVFPNTGISLPFFSYGGTSLLMTLGEMGVLLSISRASTVRKISDKN
jgi:cell division protein FtsW